MSDLSSDSKTPGSIIPRVLVVASGLLVFVLLLFADKTNLKDEGDILSGTASVSSDAAISSRQSQGLPPLAPDGKLDSWLEKLEKADDQDKIWLLDSIVVTLQSRNRFAIAADYARQLVSLESSLNNKVLAGKLSQKASRLPYVQSDSVLFRKYSSMSIRLLEGVIREAPENEEALLYLGLAYTESGVAENSMRGIMTLRGLLDLNPDNAEASFNMGMFSMQTGQYEKAEQRFSKTLEVDPGNAAAKYQLALAKLELGKSAEARSLLEALVSESKDPEVKVSASELIKKL